jgi:SAM-dependent methyltransferase
MRSCIPPFIALVLAGCGHAPCPEPASAEPTAAEAEPDPGAHGYLHGERHAFDDPQRWEPIWEGDERDAWQKPEEVLDLLELGVDMVVADIGAGTGYFAVRLAERVPAGHVWAVDVEPAMVRHINRRARDEGLDNLYGVLGRPDDPLLPEPADMVLMVNTYHHIAHRPAYLKRLRGHLSPLGRLTIVDFKMGKRPVGPPETVKVPPDQVIRELNAAGYTVVLDDRDALPHQYVLVAEPQQ